MFCTVHRPLRFGISLAHAAVAIRSRWTCSSGAPRLTPAIGKATMSRLQNKVVGTPMTQRERKAWNAAKDRRELIEAGLPNREAHARSHLEGGFQCRSSKEKSLSSRAAVAV